MPAENMGRVPRSLRLTLAVSSVALVIALATVASLVDNEGLGVPILDAISKNVFKTELIAAGALAVLLALIADALLVGVQRLLTPWARR